MLWNDTRAQSVQIGAVLMFGIFIISLSFWQAFIIPDQNEEVEFNHNQDVQEQMTELRTVVNSMPDASTTRSATIDTGVRYPTRTIFRNPPPATGLLETVETNNDDYAVGIKNAEPAENNLANLWGLNGEQSNTTYETGAIQYTPRYNEYNNPPRTLYEHSVAYNKFDLEESTLPISRQSLIRDNRISLITLDGELREEQIERTSIDFDPLSTQTQTVTVEPTDNEFVTLNIPTKLDLTRWERLIDTDVHEVTEPDTDPFETDDDIQTVQLVLDANRDAGPRSSYSLQLAHVGIGSGTSTPGSAYLTSTNSHSTTITESNTEQVTVEVRDRFNNPVSDERVNATIVNSDDFTGGELSGVEKSVEDDEPDEDTESAAITNENGKATFEFDTAGMTVSGSQDVEILFEIADPAIETGSISEDDNPTTLQETITVQEATDGDGQPAEYEIEWDEINNAGDFENCTEDDDVEECELSAGESETLSFGTIPSSVSGHAEFSLSDGSVIEDFNSGEFSKSFENGDGSVSLTAGQQDGSTDVVIYSGGDRDKVRVTVVEVGDLTIRVDDISSQTDDRGEFITSVDSVDVTDEFERVEIEYNPASGGADQINSFTSERASLRYTSGDGVFGEDVDITVTVFESDGDGGEQVAEERTIQATADAENDIEEIVRQESSPEIETSEFTDTSDDTVEYEIDYTIEENTGFEEIQAFLVGLEDDTGFDEADNVAASDSVTLSTDQGVDSEFKLALHVVDDDGVVVDTRIETVTPTADEEDPDEPLVFDGNLETVGTDGSAIQFDIQSTIDDDITIDGIQIQSTIDEASEIYGPNDGDDREVEISGSQQDGFINQGGQATNQALQTDGSSQQLEDDAIIDPSDDATVFVGDFGEVTGQGGNSELVEYSFTDLERVSEGDEDVRITLEFNDDEVDFFFAES